jgi:hypothetical protein
MPFKNTKRRKRLCLGLGKDCRRLLHVKLGGCRLAQKKPSWFEHPMQFGQHARYAHIGQSYTAKCASDAVVAKRQFFAPSAGIAPASAAVLGLGFLQPAEGNIKAYNLTIFNIQVPTAPGVASTTSKIENSLHTLRVSGSVRKGYPCFPSEAMCFALDSYSKVQELTCYFSTPKSEV